MKNIKLLRAFSLTALVFFSFAWIFAGAVSAATFNMNPDSQTFERQCQRSILVEVDATGQSANAAEVEITYDPAQITILDYYPDVAGTQVQPGNAFDTYFYNQVNAGIIKVAAASFVNVLNSRQTFARINFTSTSIATVANFTIRFDGVGATTDSNIVDSVTNNDLLTSVTNGTYTFTAGPCASDTQAPNVIFQTPTNNQTGVALNSNVTLRITDNQAGVDLSTLELIVNGVTYRPEDSQVTYTGTSTDYSFVINPDNDFVEGQAGTVVVNVRDNAGNFRTRQIIFNVPQAPAVPDTADRTQPVVTFVNPKNMDSDVPLDSQITINLVDDESGIDTSSIRVYFNESEYTAQSPQLALSSRVAAAAAAINEYDVFLTPDEDNPIVENAVNILRITGSDLAGNQFDRQIVFNIPVSAPPLNCPSVIGADSDDFICDPQNITSRTVEMFVGNALGRDNRIFENTPLEGLSKEIGTSGVIALGTGLLLLINLIPFLTIPGLLVQVLNILIGKQSKNPWGVVTDASTGKPIPFAICQLFIEGSQYKINQTVTDLEGRYGFTIPAGEYRLEVRQSGYQAFKRKIKIKEGEGNYLFDIELNHVGNTVQKTESFSTNLKRRLSEFYLRISKVILFFGFIFALIATVIAFSILNVLILGAYIFIIGALSARYLLQKPRYASIINSHNELRVPYAQLKVFDPKSWKLVESIVANYNGQFDFYGKAGKYGLLVVARGYDFPSEKNNFPIAKDKYNSIIMVNLKTGGNKLDIYVDPILTESQRTAAEVSGNMLSPFGGE